MRYLFTGLAIIAINTIGVYYIFSGSLLSVIYGAGLGIALGMVLKEVRSCHRQMDAVEDRVDRSIRGRG